MAKSNAKVRVSRPPPRLTDLANRPGGMPRDLAIARGQEALEGHRAPAQDAIAGLLCALEDGLADYPGDAQGMLRTTDQLIALANLFGMHMLERAAKRLSVLLASFHAGGESHAEALAVHVRALRLLNGSLPDATAASVIGELNRVLAHFGIREPD